MWNEIKEKKQTRQVEKKKWGCMLSSVKNIVMRKLGYISFLRMPHSVNFFLPVWWINLTRGKRKERNKVTKCSTINRFKGIHLFTSFSFSELHKECYKTHGKSIENIEKSWIMFTNSFKFKSFICSWNFPKVFLPHWNFCQKSQQSLKNVVEIPRFMFFRVSNEVKVEDAFKTFSHMRKKT